MRNLLKLVLVSVCVAGIPFAMASEYRPAGGSGSGGDGVPGGSGAEVQYNAGSGDFGGISGITSDGDDTTIDAGTGNITTTGIVTGGKVTADYIEIDGTAIVALDDGADPPVPQDLLFKFSAGTANPDFRWMTGGGNTVMTLNETGAFYLHSPALTNTGAEAFGVTMTASGVFSKLSSGGSVVADAIADTLTGSATTTQAITTTANNLTVSFDSDANDADGNFAVLGSGAKTMVDFSEDGNFRFIDDAKTATTTASLVGGTLEVINTGTDGGAGDVDNDAFVASRTADDANGVYYVAARARGAAGGNCSGSNTNCAALDGDNLSLFRSFGWNGAAIFEGGRTGFDAHDSSGTAGNWSGSNIGTDWFVRIFPKDTTPAAGAGHERLRLYADGSGYWAKDNGTNGVEMTTDGYLQKKGGGSVVADAWTVDMPLSTGTAALTGGNLRLDGSNLSSVSAESNITIIPSSSGDIVLHTDSITLGESNDSAATFTADGTVQFVVDSNANGDDLFQVREGSGTPDYLMTIADTGEFRLQVPNAAKDAGNGIVMSAAGILTKQAGGSIVADALADNAVVTANITDGNVTKSKLSPEAFMSVFGDGSDGAFNLTSSACPSVCDCDDAGGTRTCTITRNSRFGYGRALRSAVYNFTTFTMGDDTKIVLTATPAGEVWGGGGMLIIRATGDAVLNDSTEINTVGAGSSGAKISGTANTACNVGTGTCHGGDTYCADHPATQSLAATGNACTPLTWKVGDNIPLLFGSGGGKFTGTSSVDAADTLAWRTFGGTGGNGGDNTNCTAAAGLNGDSGSGGGGLALFVGGDLTFSDDASEDTVLNASGGKSGGDIADNNAGGGGGSGSILIAHCGTFTTTTDAFSYLTAGGAGGNCNNGSGTSAATAGGTGGASSHLIVNACL